MDNNDQIFYPQNDWLLNKQDGDLYNTENSEDIKGNEMRDQSYSSNLSSFSQDSLNSRPPIQSSKIQDSNSNIAADKFPKKQTEEGKFAVCRRCGHMSLNYTMCESCGRSLPEDVQFFMPEKKIKTGDNTINNLQTTPVKTLNPRKSIQKPGAKGTGSKRSTFGLRKETDVVHILSSDDEDKVNQQPAISHNCLKSISELGGCAPSFSIQLTDVYFGKIHCSTIKTCTAEADRITLSGVGPSGNIIKLISTSLELMLLAAFFQPKACSHVFLHTHFTSALKFIRETVPNSTVLYDSDCQDDCAKYIVLFLKHEDQSEGLETRIPETVAAMQQYRRAKSSNANQHIGPQYKTIDSFDVAAFMNSVRSSGSVELEIPSSVGIEEMEGIEGEEQMHSTNKMRSATFSSNIINLFTYPPPPATGGIPVTNEDLFCLNEGEFLNDVIIDFYLKYLSLELLENQLSSTHIFSSFFFKRLTQRLPSKKNDEETMDMSIQQKRHANVRTWTRHVDLFAKDFVVVPINENAHWYLAIICYPGLETSQLELKVESPPKTDSKGKPKRKNAKQNHFIRKMPCILIFDSLVGPMRSPAIKSLREYLQVEWNLKRKAIQGDRVFTRDHMKGVMLECPQQSNYSDCGLYMLQYVESFFKILIKDFSFPSHHLNVAEFEPQIMSSKRSDIQNLILKMTTSLNPNLEYCPQMDGCIIPSSSNGQIQETNFEGNRELSNNFENSQSNFKNNLITSAEDSCEHMETNTTINMDNLDSNSNRNNNETNDKNLT